MFERLIQWLIEIRDRIMPIVEVDAYQGAALLRFGRLHRTLGPGWHFKWPLIENAFHADACTTTMRLLPQTLTTKDGHTVCVQAVVRYSIRDVGKYIVGITDQVDALADITAGKIAESIETSTFDEWRLNRPTKEIAYAIRRHIGKYGFELEELTFTDFGRVRTFRLIQPGPANVAN